MIEAFILICLVGAIGLIVMEYRLAAGAGSAKVDRVREDPPVLARADR